MSTQYAALVDTVLKAERSGDRLDAERALVATLETLGYLLPGPVVNAMERDLPSECGIPLGLGQRVAATRLIEDPGPMPLALLQRVQVAWRALGQLLPAEVLWDVAQQLPKEYRALFDWPLHDDAAVAPAERAPTPRRSFMDVREAISTRRSVRAFNELPVEPAVVERLLRAAVQAPSAMNRQPWLFAVVQDRALLADFSQRAKRQALATTAFEQKARNYEPLLKNPEFDIFYGGGTLILIGCAERSHFAAGDCWLAAQNLMLTACAEGLATCCVGFAFDLLNMSEVKRQLGFPDGGAIVAAIVVGSPAEVASAVPRDAPKVVQWITGPKPNMVEKE